MRTEAYATARATTPRFDASDEPAKRVLRDWHLNSVPVSFLYSRSMGGLLQVGRAVITRLDEQAMNLKTSDGSILILTKSAKFSTEPQLFFTPSFLGSHYVEGVSLFLENHDWLFLSASAHPEQLAGSPPPPALK